MGVTDLIGKSANCDPYTFIGMQGSSAYVHGQSRFFSSDGSPAEARHGVDYTVELA